MAHDLVVRGGNIVDGSGNEPFEGDLGIGDGGAYYGFRLAILYAVPLGLY
jgi:hypothetical protein